MERFRVQPDRTLMVGDQPSDLTAAQHARTSFLAVGSGAAWVGDAASVSVPVIGMLVDLASATFDSVYDP